MVEGVECLEGIDTLLMHLLLDLDASREASAFAAVPNRVDSGEVAARLRARGWTHALATLWAARGEAEAALGMWRDVAGGQSPAHGEQQQPPHAPHAQQQQRHAEADRREAIEAAGALLCDPAACPPDLLPQYLPWLLAASPPTAMAVLKARRPPPASVLPLLPLDGDVRWQYLHHLVHEAGSTEPAIHTELALQLVEAVLRLAPHLRSPGAPPTRPPSRRGSSLSGSSAPAARRAASRSVLALVGEGEGEGPAGSLRAELRRHLEGSALLDSSAVLRGIVHSGLHEEMVVLCCKVWLVKGERGRGEGWGV